ncbi:MAG: polysaccharide deacetylase family protein [Myxococcales bacterium]|nr:polysaccharide deacetylase family protein [Myxococcales bacterium]
MSLLSRITVVALAAAAGSWVGLGRPEPTPVHVPTLLGRARAWVTSSVGAGEAAKTPAPATPQRAPVAPLAPLPHESAPDKVTSRPVFPQTNPTRSVERAWIVAEGPEMRPGDGRRYVTFTFDDGPSPRTTPRVLRLLAQHDVRATFFVLGRYLVGDRPRARASRKVLEDIVKAGHLVGNHTRDHEVLTHMTPAQAAWQIDASAVAIQSVTGHYPILFRPPFGKLDDASRELVRARGLELVLWSAEKSDMTRDDPEAMFHELAAQIEYKHGGLVLLHDVKGTSVTVLRLLLEWLKDKRYDPRRPDRWGYEIVDLPRYLELAAERPQPYETRDELEKARLAAWRSLHPGAHAPRVDSGDESPPTPDPAPRRAKRKPRRR